jgi:histidine ammonia-lyase
MPARRAWDRVKRRPVRLAPKEGLALVNGTQMMAAVGVLALLRAERLARVADVVGAMTLEALLGSHRAFRADLQAARPHPGQRQAAANLRRLLKDSPIERSHVDCSRVQDSYSLRCMPQVHGAVRDGLGHVRRVLEIEINSSTDNPMLLGDVLVAGGNFHGQPVSLALDHLAIAAASLGTIAERRIERLLNPDLSALPPFLAHDAGLHSGFMMAHVTAAALVAENKILAHPASVDSIPTSAAKEDHVSMGAHAARKAEQVIAHVGWILAIEALCAAQALDMLAPLRAGAGVEAARRAFRRSVRHLDADRVMSTEIELSRQTIESSEWMAAIERVSGPLK